MYCKNCGNELSPGTKSCPVCGMWQNGEAPPQAPRSTPVYQATPKKKMPLIPILAAVLVLAVASVAFSVFQSQNEKKQLQQSLTTYIEDDLEDLQKLEEQIVEELDDALAEADGETALNQFEDVKKLCADLVLKVLDINASLEKDSELAEVNSHYSRFAKKTSDAVDYLVSLVEDGTGGESAVRKFVSMLEDADEEYSEFQEKLAALAGEREVNYRQNDELPLEDIIKKIEELF